MSLPKLDLKQALDLFKMMNRGGIASVVVIGGVISFMLLTQCGPVIHSSNYGDANAIGQVAFQDHPEEMVADDHAHGDDHGHDDHATEEHAEEEAH